MSPSPASHLDKKYADRFLAECSSGDTEGDGCAADRVLDDLLRELGMPAAADIYANLSLWRA